LEQCEEFGEVENGESRLLWDLLAVKVLNFRGIAFVRYKYRVSAEFAKVCLLVARLIARSLSPIKASLQMR
jgi:hypothetical protein